MRRLKPDTVPEPLLLRLLEAANQAPSASNTQLTRWIVVRDPQVREKLASLNAIQVAKYLESPAASPQGLPHQDRDRRARMLQALRWQADHLAQVPALIIACHLFTAEPNDALRAHAASSVWPAIQNLLLAARALGLGATPTTLGLRDRDAVRATLSLPINVEAYCLIPIGYPMGRFGPVTRLPVADTVRFDSWS